MYYGDDLIDVKDLPPLQKKRKRRKKRDEPVIKKTKRQKTLPDAMPLLRQCLSIFPKYIPGQSSNVVTEDDVYQSLDILSRVKIYA